MTHRWRPALLAALFIGSAVLPLHAVPPPPAEPGIEFIGRGMVAGNALDLSGLNGKTICPATDADHTPPNPDAGLPCIDQATLGGWGSGITYTGHDNVFLAVPDRGPFNGRASVPYLDRFHFLHITVDQSQPKTNNVKVTLLDTRFMKDEHNRSLLGDAYSFAPNYVRLDPEGVRATPDGNFIVSDEYGPFLFKFDRNGHLQTRYPVPDYYQINNPAGDVDTLADAASVELYHTNNTVGRQANRGMEGVSLTPDGKWLVGIMQNALIQDNGLDYKGAADKAPGETGAKSPGRLSLNNRIFVLNLTTGETHEFVYVIDAIGKGRGVNELLAINDHEFLVLERDNQTNIPTPTGAPPEGVPGKSTPAEKTIYRIDLNELNGGALPTDVANQDTLPATFTPVKKHLFIDMLNPAYQVDATHTIKDVVPEKMEGMAWGPDLPDGRHVLYVVSDNDLFAGGAIYAGVNADLGTGFNVSYTNGLPTQIYAFAVKESDAGVTVVPQNLPGPLFPPGQVKKILGK